MKKFSLAIMSALLLSLTVVGCGNANTNNNAEKEEKVIRVGATGQSFPNAYKENEKLVGYDVEVIETIAKDLGYKVQWTTMDFAGAMGQLDQGKLDTVANSVAVTEERKEKYNFTDAYSYAGAQIVTSKDNTDINTLEDLKGKTISGVAGSNNVKIVNGYFKNGEVTVRTYETRDGAMNDAISNRVDGYVNSRGVLAAEIAKKNLPLKFVGDPLNFEEVAFPFVKNEKGEELQKQFNEELKKLKEDGTLKKISEKYFNEDITVKK